MARARLGMLALVVTSACGQIEREPFVPMTMSGAGTSGVGTSGAGTSGAGTSGAGSSGLAGSGGLSQVQPAIAECQNYCQTLGYLLPGALCEDWNRPEWDPSFCRSE